jgi:hypothetical protein
MRVKADAVIAAIAHLHREWGDYGYWIEKIEEIEEGPLRGGATIHVVHSDGSRFTISADAYGQILHEDRLCSCPRAGCEAHA